MWICKIAVKSPAVHTNFSRHRNRRKYCACKPSLIISPLLSAHVKAITYGTEWCVVFVLSWREMIIFTDRSSYGTGWVMRPIWARKVLTQWGQDSGAGACAEGLTQRAFRAARMVLAVSMMRKGPCKRTQQITTLLAQQCWELLTLFGTCCVVHANERNNCQHCWRKVVILALITALSAPSFTFICL